LYFSNNKLNKNHQNNSTIESGRQEE